MSDSVIKTVENVVQLDKLSDEVKLKIIGTALSGKLDITDMDLIQILQDAYKTNLNLPTSNAQTQKTLENKPSSVVGGEILCLIEFAGKLISGNSSGEIQIWDPTNLATYKYLGSHSEGSVNCFVVANGHLYSGANGEVKIWNSNFQLVKTITFNDVGKKSKVTQMFYHHGSVEVGFESGHIKSIYNSGFGVIHINHYLEYSIRNFIPIGYYVYVCTSKAIFKLNSVCTEIISTIKDERTVSNEDWTHIRLIEDNLYAFDGRGDIYKITDDKIEHIRHPISPYTYICHIWVSEYINDNLYIGSYNGRIRKFAKFPKSNDFDTNYLCQNYYLKCSTTFGNNNDKLYIGCSCGRIHTYEL